jgi:FkbM family methyltransferase
MDLTRRDSVSVIGFEPSVGCVRAIEKSMALNKRTNFTIFNCLVGDEDTYIPFDAGSDAQGASVYQAGRDSRKVRQVRLDDVGAIDAIEIGSPTILMIDVEGYEPKVLRGGAKLVTRLRPLIVFEYNLISKRYFDLGEIRRILGPGYNIFRLRKDALLDKETEAAWNCVAVPCNSEFENIVKHRICAE